MDKFNSNLSIGYSNGKKYDCPKCGSKHKGRYSRFAIFDGSTEVQLLDYSYGKCDRVNTCQYQKTVTSDYYYQVLDTYRTTGKVYSDYPTKEEYIASKKKGKPKYKRPYIKSSYKQRIEDINRAIDNRTKVKPEISEINVRHYIPFESYNRFQFKSGDLSPYFFDGLPVEPDLLDAVLLKYCIGTLKDKYVSKSNLLLPYIDINGKLHGVEIKEFDRNRRTLKMPDGSKVNKQYHVYKSTSDSIKSVLGDINGNKFLNEYRNQKPQKETCFGTHLITEDTSVINVFEGCKNAILFELLNKQTSVVNIATGGQANLTSSRFLFLKEPKFQHIEIRVIPDNDSIEDWTSKIQKIRNDLQTIVSFKIVSCIQMMQPYFFDLIDPDGTARNEPSFDSNFYLHRYSDISEIDIADLILEYWKLDEELDDLNNNEDLIEHAPRVQPVKQVATSNDKSSIPTEIERKSIKRDISIESKKKEYRLEANGKVSYINGTTLLEDLPAKSSVILFETEEWTKYNLFNLFNELTGLREIRKVPFFVPDDAVISEMTGKGWIIETKVEVDNTRKPVQMTKDTTRVQMVNQVATSNVKATNTTESPISFVKRDLYDLSKERKKLVQSKSKKKESQQLEMFV